MRIQQPRPLPPVAHRPKASAVLLAAAVAAALAVPAAAQRQFEIVGKRGLPLDLHTDSTATAFGDVDGDGDLDLVVARFNAQAVLLRNDGAGEFTDATSGRMPVASSSAVAVALGDIDGDGDLDLVIGNNNGPSLLYRNNGAGTFADVSATQLPNNTFACSAVAFGDIDNDGDLDLLMGNVSRQTQLLINNGAGVYSDQSATRLPALTRTVSSVVFGDIDFDGDLDLVVGTRDYYPGPQNRVLRNNGGVFADVTASSLPSSTDITTSLALGDVDGDGDLDLVVGNTRSQYQFIPSPQTRLYRNDGTGVFTDVTVTKMPADGDKTTSVALRDIDGDGDLDLAIGNRDLAPGQQNRLYRNDGTGTFTNITGGNLPARADTTTALAFGDVDGDGDADLVVANSADPSGFIGDQQDRLLLNDGTGVFLDAAAPKTPATLATFTAVAHGDFDGDGDEDLVLGGLTLASKLYRNDGKGVFADVTAGNLPPLSLQVSKFAVGDVDGDGDLDLVAGSGTSAQCQLLLNNGGGVFTNGTGGRLPASNTQTRGIALVDVDGDGDRDLVLANFAQQSLLYRNNGLGVFTDVTAAQVPTAPSLLAGSVAAGDFDGDGDVDLAIGVTGQFFGPSGGQNRLYLNNGAGTFTDATAGRMPVDLDYTEALAAGDVDGDGDLDLVCGNTSAYYTSGQNRLYRNNGAGTFTVAAGLPAVIGTTIGLALADGDGDGDLDLLVGRGRNIVGGSGNDDYFVNAGNGQFSFATARTPLISGSTTGVAMVDLDRDGDRELVVCRSVAVGGTTLSVSTNLVRQLDAPQLLRIGRNYRLDVYARFGPAGANDFALPYFTPFEANFVFPPLGIVGIDPGSAVALPPIPVPQPAGLGSLPVPVPFLPALLGVPVHIQAILSQQPVQDRLTGVVTDPIVR